MSAEYSFKFSPPGYTVCPFDSTHCLKVVEMDQHWSRCSVVRGRRANCLPVYRCPFSVMHGFLNQAEFDEHLKVCKGDEPEDVFFEKKEHQKAKKPSDEKGTGLQEKFKGKRTVIFSSAKEENKKTKSGREIKIIRIVKKEPFSERRINYKPTVTLKVNE